MKAEHKNKSVYIWRLLKTTICPPCLESCIIFYLKHGTQLMIWYILQHTSRQSLGIDWDVIINNNMEESPEQVWVAGTALTDDCVEGFPHLLFPRVIISR